MGLGFREFRGLGCRFFVGLRGLQIRCAGLYHEGDLFSFQGWWASQSWNSLHSSFQSTKKCYEIGYYKP